tara:strand:+ start:1 stop:1755 length:1755 start_codon:yes stop_codon:yes gene_type:complete
MEGAGDTGRAWHSTAQLRYKNHLVLPGLATDTTTPTHSLVDATIGAINTLNNEVYAFWNGSESVSPQLFKYNNNTSSWASALTQSATDQVTDSVVFTNSGGTTYLVFAHYDSNGSGYTYSSNGSSWTTDSGSNGDNVARAAKFLAVWDERLWGITHAGQLWYSTTIGTEILDAVLPVPVGFVTALFVARNAAGIPILYAATKTGLFAHNADNARWEETQMSFPVHPDNGKGTTVWRDSVYIPSGLGIYRYINGNNAAVVSLVGPDRDDGLPADKRGTVRMVEGTHNELMVGIDATSAPSTISSTSLPYQWVSHHGSPVIAADSGYSSILGYNELGWEVKWQASDSGLSIDSMHASSAYDKYRLWWGYNDQVYFMPLQRDIINPSEIPEFEYATSAVHETPWFSAGQSEVDKLALKLRTEVQGMSSTETVVVQYAINYAENYTTTDSTITSNGTDIYTFGTKVGVSFRSIKFRLTLARSTAITTGLEKFESPDVVSLTLEWRKKLPAKWGHTVEVDLNNEYKGNSPKDLRSNLISSIESTTLVEFTFRDDGGGTRNYYVDVVSASGMEFTGYDERGSTQISVVEP